MQRSSFRLSGPLQAAVYGSFALLLGTGAAWMFARTRDEDSWRELPPLLMKIHGAAAMVCLLVLGAVTLHIKRGWKADRNRLSGSLLIALSAFLVVTGYGLYYAGGEALREWISRWHAWLGLGLAALLPAHVFAGRWLGRRAHLARVSARETPAREIA